MKSKKEIRDKAFQVMERCLKESKKELLSRKVTNCSMSEKLMDCNVFVGYCCSCERKSDHVMQVCHDDRASTCLSFECKNTPETVKEQFKSLLRNPALCGEKYPKLSALLWVLGGELSDKEVSNTTKRFSIKEWFKSWAKHISA